MANDKPKTVTVEALKPHTYNGEAYDVGDTYEIDAQYADSVASQGMAVRTDRVQKAKADKAKTDKADRHVMKTTDVPTTRKARLVAKPIRRTK